LQSETGLGKNVRVPIQKNNKSKKKKKKVGEVLGVWLKRQSIFLARARPLVQTPVPPNKNNKMN
jgi:hypothetical protein